MERKRLGIVSRAAIVALVTVVLTTAFLAAAWTTSPALALTGSPPPGFIEVINPASTVVYGPYPSNMGYFVGAVEYGDTHPGDKVLVAQGFTDTLNISLPINASGLWIEGPASGVGVPMPTINLNSFTITIDAKNVLIWGLNLIQSTGLNSYCLEILGGSDTVENNTIMGNGVGGGIYIQSSSNNIALNTLSNFGDAAPGITAGIIIGLGSNNTVELNTLNPPYYIGINLLSTAGSGNMIWWNNLIYASPGIYPILDNSNKTNTYDNLNKGNYYDSWPIGVPPYKIPGTNPNYDNYPLPSPAKHIPGDITGGPNGCPDGKVSGPDLHALGLAWGTSWGQYGYDPRADLTGIGSVGGAALHVLGLYWGTIDP